jgi:hypothetical protein
MAQGSRNEPTVEPSEADYWYAAGFIDGEGCITVRRNQPSASNKDRGWNPSWYASVTISQVDRRPLDWFAERWGGAVRPLKRRGGARGLNERDAFEWCVVGRQAYRLLEGVQSFLQCKDAAAVNALKLKGLRDGRGFVADPATGRRNRLTKDELAERQAIRDEALRLNRRGRVEI